jgi:flagellar FliL protein
MAEDEVNEAEDGAGEGEESEEGEQKSGLKKKLLLVAIPVLLLVIGGGLYFTGIIGGGSGEGDDVVAEEVVEEEPVNSGFYALPDLIVNLSSDRGAQFLKLRVQLEVKDEADLPAIEAIAPRVIDQFQTYLREMRVEDLRGSAGIYRLRQELLYRVNLAAHPVEVKDVLFQEMLIQ